MIKTNVSDSNNSSNIRNNNSSDDNNENKDGGNGANNNQHNNTIIHLRGLPREVSIAEGVKTVTQLCSDYGKVTECFLIKRKGQAFVRMSKEEETKALLCAKTLCIRDKAIIAQLSTRTNLFDADKDITNHSKNEKNNDSTLTAHASSLTSPPFSLSPVFIVWPSPISSSFIPGDCVVVKIKKKHYFGIVCVAHPITVDVLLQPSSFPCSPLMLPSAASLFPFLFPIAASFPLVAVSTASVIRWARPPPPSLFPFFRSSISDLSVASELTLEHLLSSASNVNPVLASSGLASASSVLGSSVCPVWVCQETTYYHHLAKTQVCSRDVALEIGCDFGACCLILARKCRTVLGIDKEADHVAVAQQRVPSAHFRALDVLFDTDGFVRCVREVELDIGAPTSVVFIDINGNRDLRPVCSVLGLVLRELRPTLVVVKSKALYQRERSSCRPASEIKIELAA